MAQHGNRYAILILVFVGLLSAMYYATSIAGCIECADQHRAVILRSADSPYRYRVLPAYFAQAFSVDLGPKSILSAYIVAHMLVLPIMLTALYVWYRQYASIFAALAATLLIAVYLPMMFLVWGTSLGSAIEPLLLSLALLVLVRRPRGWSIWILLLTIISTLNRETAVLIPLVYLAFDFPQWRKRAYWTRGALYSVIWLAVFVGLRLWLGTAPDDVPITSGWANNTGGGWWTTEALWKLPMFVPVFVLYARGWSRAPSPLKRLVVPLIFYLALYLTFGFWHEVRLLLPALVIMIPVSLKGLQ